MADPREPEPVLDPALGGVLPSHRSRPQIPPYKQNPPQYGPESGNPYYSYYPSTAQAPAQSSIEQQQFDVAPTPQQHSSSARPFIGDGASPQAGPNDAKRPRACDACRALKVKCELDPDQPDVPCKRCTKGNKVCNVSEPTRKRQKKSDSRVAELEKRIEDLTSAFRAQTGGRSLPSPLASAVQSYDTSPSYSAPTTEPEQSLKRKYTDDGPYPQAPAYQPRKVVTAGNDRGPITLERSWGIDSDILRNLHHTAPEDLIRRINNLILPQDATRLFERYNNELSPHLPAVVFPPGTTAESLYKEKPLLYLAVIGTASWGQIAPEASREVIREAIGTIADCAIRNGAKTLELIQCMQILTLWYKPPEKTEQTNFYQIIHISAVMALDIGLGQRFKPRRRGLHMPPLKDGEQGSGCKRGKINSDELDARRAWLGCYYLCASASMVLRRPNLVRWSNYMDECVAELESNPEAAPTDKLFCQHIKLQHICEQIGQQFYMDDPSATKIDINDAQVSYNVKSLENDLSKWKQNIPASCQVPGLVFFEHVCNLYAHEIVLHHNHNVDDFKMPFSEESLRNVNSGAGGTLSQNQITALRACVVASHGILETMMEFEQKVIAAMPMLLYFVRCVYAIVILIKMHVAVHIPNSELGKLYTAEDLKVEFYLNGLISHFERTGYQGQQGHIRPDKVLRILGVLRDWFEEKHKKDIAAALAGNDPSADAEARHSEQEPVTENTGLNMLSQAASTSQPSTAQQQHAQQQDPEQQPISTDWTVDHPNFLRYIPPQPTDPSILHQPNGGYNNFAEQNQAPTDAEQNLYTEQGAWDLGVQQAMDMALGDVNGLQENGLDSWLLGEGSMMPFMGFEMGQPY